MKDTGESSSQQQMASTIKTQMSMTLTKKKTPREKQNSTLRIPTSTITHKKSGSVPFLSY